MNKKIILPAMITMILIGVTKLRSQIPAFQYDLYIEELMKTKKVPGACLAIIEEGELVSIKAFGFADFATNVPMTLKHGFNVGSISKTFTAWAIMKLVEENQVLLDDPIFKYDLECLAHISKANQIKITIRDLLQHTAGLSVHGYEGYVEAYDLPSICESIQGSKREEEKVFVTNDPGSKFEYSGGGYTLLQMIIEKVTGVDFQNYMNRALFQPLNMKHSSFKIDEKVLKNSAVAHDTTMSRQSLELFTAQAAAGLHTTIEDLVLFVRAHFDHNQVLSDSSITLLQQGSPQSKGDYGKGYMIMERFGSFTLHGHGGSNDGWQSGMMIDMKNKSAFIMLTNGSNGKEVIFPTLMKWGMDRRKALMGKS